MGLAIGQSTVTTTYGTQSRQPNFGSLVSAINRGDVEGAQNAFQALTELAPKTPGPLRKGALDAMEKALKEADLEAAKKALRDIQQGMLAKASSSVVSAGLAAGAGSSINILV